jgi:hypothetical protein
MWIMRVKIRSIHTDLPGIKRLRRRDEMEPIVSKWSQ